MTMEKGSGENSGVLAWENCARDLALVSRASEFRSASTRPRKRRGRITRRSDAPGSHLNWPALYRRL